METLFGPSDHEQRGVFALINSQGIPHLCFIFLFSIGVTHDYRHIDIMYDFTLLLGQNGLLFYAWFILSAFFFKGDSLLYYETNFSFRFESTKNYRKSQKMKYDEIQMKDEIF